MQQQTVDSFVVGCQAQIAALKPGIELEVAGLRDEWGGLFYVEDEVILAEGLELVDREDVECKRRGVAIEIEAVIYYVFLLEVSDDCRPQWYEFSPYSLAATLIREGRDAVGEASRRCGRTQVIGIQTFDDLFCGFDYFVGLGKDVLDLQIELILGELSALYVPVIILHFIISKQPCNIIIDIIMSNTTCLLIVIDVRQLDNMESGAGVGAGYIWLE